MTCDNWRSAHSAMLDGEDPGETPRALAKHARACASCRAWAARAEDLHRSIRVAALAPVPDLTAPILTAIGPGPAPRPRPRRGDADAGRDPILRVVLAVLASAQILAAIPALLGDDAGVPIHTAHHLGSLDLAIGVGFLAAAWRPRLIRGFLPVAIALVACTVLTSTVDVLSGNAALGGELQHIVGIAALAITWILSRHQSEAEPAPRVPAVASSR
jgi:predicted anti-sigma-YlaC factor YlaD